MRVSFLSPTGVPVNWHEDVGFEASSRMPSFDQALEKARFQLLHSSLH